MGGYLGVDVGGTASRWVLLDDTGSLVRRGDAPGATGLIFDAASQLRFRQMLEAVRDALPGGIDFAQFGITGTGFDANPRVEDLVSEVLRLPGSRFAYANDMVTAWYAAFPQATGHLISAGTGSVGIARDTNGEFVTVGGRGAMVDDGGSGTWIGLQALRGLYRLIDERGRPKGAEALAAAMFEKMGGEDYETFRAFVYGGDRGRIGTLAVAVAEAAREGDPLAQDVLRRAGLELCRLGRILCARFGAAPVGFIGGVLRLDPSIRETIRTGLSDRDVLFPEVDAAYQAAMMARDKGAT